jgi:hypothetical protein
MSQRPIRSFTSGTRLAKSPLPGATERPHSQQDSLPSSYSSPAVAGGMAMLFIRHQWLRLYVSTFGRDLAQHGG